MSCEECLQESHGSSIDSSPSSLAPAGPPCSQPTNIQETHQTCHRPSKSTEKTRAAAAHHSRVTAAAALRSEQPPPIRPNLLRQRAHRRREPLPHTILAGIFGKRSSDPGEDRAAYTRRPQAEVHRSRRDACPQDFAEIIGGITLRDSCDSRVRDTLRLPARARPSVRVGERPLRKRSTGEEE